MSDSDSDDDYCCHKCGNPDHTTDECQVCTIWNDVYHNTENHQCPICDLKGLKSHFWLNCPEICIICGFQHKTIQHKCRICGKNNHGWLECPQNCIDLSKTYLYISFIEGINS